jgi:hypothetical protein
VTANAGSFPIDETSIAASHAAYLSGHATVVSVCQAHLDRIAAYDRKGPCHAAANSETAESGKTTSCDCCEMRENAA